MAADKYAALADAARYRGQLTSRARRAEINAADPEPYNRANFVYTTAEGWAQQAADLDAAIEALDAQVDATREQLRRAD